MLGARIQTSCPVVSSMSFLPRKDEDEGNIKNSNAAWFERQIGHTTSNSGRVGSFSNGRRFSVESSLQVLHRIRWVETNEFVVSNPIVIYTQKTCGQRSSMAEGSKRRAIAFYFPIRFWYMFPILKCTEKSDVGLWTFSGLGDLRKQCSCAVATSNTTTRWAAKFVGSRYRAAAFFCKSQKKCMDLELRRETLFHILILGTYSKIVWENKFLALTVCFPQPSWHTRALAVFLPHQDLVWITTDEYIRFRKIEFD